MNEALNPNVNLIAVTISADKLSASIAYTGKEDLGPYDIEQLRQLLRANGIKHGIMDDQLARFAANPSAYTRPLLVAKGDPPEPGVDGRIEYLFQKEL